MKPINNWDNVKASGDFETLPGGGYICEIKSAKEKPNRNSSGSHIELMLEVVDGEYKGFFERDYKAQTSEDKFWHGIINQNIPNESSEKYDIQCSFFKRFTDAIEDSNPSYHWDWNEAGLKGKLCGCVFAEKEKESKKGTVYIISYANEIVPVEAIKNGKFKVPAVKRLEKQLNSSGNSPFNEMSSGDSDDDLPF